MRLQGKNAIVTGGASGIGEAIARGFATHGASVMVADVDLPQADNVASEIRANGGNSLAVRVDVSERDQVEAMLHETVQAFGRIHILVCSAGISTTAPFLELPEADWDRVLRVNLKGLSLWGQTVARPMADQEGGAIINLTSQTQEIAQPHVAHYVATKGGGKKLTKAMALDLVGHDIRVNALAAGLTNTAMSDLSTRQGRAFRRKVLKRIPMGRPAEPEEMVGTAVFLGSDEASYETGATLVVDGEYLSM